MILTVVNHQNHAINIEVINRNFERKIVGLFDYKYLVNIILSSSRTRMSTDAQVVDAQP